MYNVGEKIDNRQTKEATMDLPMDKKANRGFLAYKLVVVAASRMRLTH